MKLEDIGITKEDILTRVAETLTAEIAEDTKRGIAQFVEDEVKTHIRSQVSSIIVDTARKTFDSTFQPVDHFGDKIGEPTTIREMFVKQAKEWWNLKVDSNGSPTKDNWGNKETMAQFHAKEAMSKVVRETMKSQFEPLLADAKAQLTCAFTQAISELVSKTLAKK